MTGTDPVERLIHETRQFVEMRPAPDVVAAVMRDIEQVDVHSANKSHSWIARFVRSLWTSRSVTFEFRPAYALLAVASVLTFAAVVPHYSSAGGQVTVTGAQGVEQEVYVQFRLQTSDATDVRLAGSFTQWQPQYQLHETAPGLWTVTLPLEPGVHDYAFLVDGRRWVTDPYAPAVQDGFGGTNSRITLIAGSGRRL